MIIFLIGHRGSGKTHLAQRMVEYFRSAGQEAQLADLDQIIERGEKASILDIFKNRGEAEFRELEAKYLGDLCEEFKDKAGHRVIVLGAGFQGPLPWAQAPDSFCLWVRRRTDHCGRVFLNRPRLNPERSPLEEYLVRYHEREPRFKLWAHEEILISEGFDHPNSEERGFFLDTLQAKGAILTLNSSLWGDGSEGAQARWQRFIQRRLRWGLRLEVRDDLLSPDQINQAFQTIPHSQLLFSIRKNLESPLWIQALKEGALWDWPAEHKTPQGFRPPILSLHQRESHDSIWDVGRKLENAAEGSPAHLKLAVEVRTFDELWQGHLWQAEDPSSRSFLPRSPEGRWSWYRLLMKNSEKLCFVREGEGSAPDQPDLLEWVRAPQSPQHFAAILGDPVLHSRTPGRHHAFFSKKQMPVLAIRVTEPEWSGAIDVLGRLGLRAAAVTAPLKLKAAQTAEYKTPEAERFQSVNTLSLNKADHRWSGANTDLQGLRALLGQLTGSEKTAVWGGGGTLPLLQEALPQGVFYSARTGLPRKTPAPFFSPEVLVWGVGRSHYSDRNPITWPPSSWKPKLLIDLNYSDDSPGKEYALRTGAQYRSGVAMFHAQAKEQQRLWGEALFLE